MQFEIYMEKKTKPQVQQNSKTSKVARKSLTPLKDVTKSSNIRGNCHSQTPKPDRSIKKKP